MIFFIPAIVAAPIVVPIVVPAISAAIIAAIVGIHLAREQSRNAISNFVRAPRLQVDPEHKGGGTTAKAQTNLPPNKQEDEKASPLPSLFAPPKFQLDPAETSAPLANQFGNFGTPVLNPSKPELMPQRRLPPTPSPVPGLPPSPAPGPAPLNFPPIPTIKVQRPIQRRRVGTLIPPILSKSQPKIEICGYEINTGGLRRKQTSAKQNFTKAKLELQNGINLTKKSPNFLKKQAALFTLEKNPKTGKRISSPLYGLEEIAEMLHLTSARKSHIKFPVQTALHTAFEIVTCSMNLDIDVDDDELQPDCCCPEIDECFIPVRNFKSNEDHSLGYKTQLQINFGQSDKRISIPAPKANLTKNDIIQAVIRGSGSTSPYFGQIKCEVDVKPYGYIRYYAKDKWAGKRMIDALEPLIDGSIVPDSFRSSDRKRKFTVGNYPVVVAYLFQFDAGGGFAKQLRIDLT